VAVGDATTLNGLFAHLKSILKANGITYRKSAVYGDFRAGDIRHSLADIRKSIQRLGYGPAYPVRKGLETAMPWYIRNQASGGAPPQLFNDSSQSDDNTGVGHGVVPHLASAGNARFS
jgi:dTDP-D-glucose 4,6-dehydratase